MSQLNSIDHRVGDAYLRAIAIISVVTIHFLAGLDGTVYKTAWYQPFIVSLDQLCRISVPLFVALSGYGLMQKYQTVEFQWSEFFRRRVWKLLPQYLFWTVITFMVFLIIPSWRPDGLPTSIITQILFGKADYHLYFVPMIFQLYLLFPFLRKLISRHAKKVLLVSFVFQFVLYLFYAARPQTLLPQYLLATDYQQYPWFFTWIFYFVLGMSLPYLHQRLNKRGLSTIVCVLAYLSWGWSSFSGLQAIERGVDPIIALRFTRISILIYTTAAITWLTWRMSKELPRVPVLKKIGDTSYWTYLIHTMLLRVWFTLF